MGSFEMEDGMTGISDIHLPEPINEVWVLRWDDTCERANEVVRADEGGWLMFKDREHAEDVAACYGWSYAKPDRLLPRD